MHFNNSTHVPCACSHVLAIHSSEGWPELLFTNRQQQSQPSAAYTASGLLACINICCLWLVAKAHATLTMHQQLDGQLHCLVQPDCVPSVLFKMSRCCFLCIFKLLCNSTSLLCRLPLLLCQRKQSQQTAARQHQLLAKRALIPWSQSCSHHQLCPRPGLPLRCLSMHVCSMPHVTSRCHAEHYSIPYMRILQICTMCIYQVCGKTTCACSSCRMH